ncbi:prepilin peptidase [Clostridium gasigenes]|uniref:Prepilin peptidase n=1 Tax=Clostridium gasigenes TaxID=94869 RepID=A0A7X0VT54_9CLOT|nr:prepilin peptidase [Clostridium gasigenes]MBB6716643.1 prepilin peptidase [Clostridium gasigenes]
MSYKIVICIFLLASLATYVSLYICNYINNNDQQDINCQIKTKLTLSLVNGILVSLLFIKYSLNIYSFLYVLLWLILFVISYIDYSTKYIYDITTKPLKIVAYILFVINLISGVTNLKDIIWLLIAISIVILFSKLKYIGKGDISVFCATMMVLNTFMGSLILLVFSFGVSGVVSIFLLAFKKIGLDHRKPLCPSIAVAMYIILILT